MLHKKEYFRNLEVFHDEGIYLGGDIIEVLINCVEIKPNAYTLNGVPLYNKNYVTSIISSLSLETIHQLVKDSI